MPLTDLAIRRAKPAAKPQKLSDAGGLYLYVTVAGAKSWRWKYRFEGKEKVLALGCTQTRARPTPRSQATMPAACCAAEGLAAQVGGWLRRQMRWGSRDRTNLVDQIQP